MPDSPPSTPNNNAHLSSKGEIKVWLTATGLNVGLFMIAGLLLLIAWNGLSVFWPQPVNEFLLTTEKNAPPEKVAGVITKKQTRRAAADGQEIQEIQLFTGNRDAYGLAFRFLDQSRLASTTNPPDLVVAERTEYGKALFYPTRLQLAEGNTIDFGEARFLSEFTRLVNAGNARRAEILKLEKHEIGAINFQINKLELRLRQPDLPPKERTQTEQALSTLRTDYTALAAKAGSLRDRQKLETLVYRLASGEERTQAVSEIIHFYQPNQLNLWGRIKIFFHHILAFLTEEPREANTEGGIFPAIFGTFVMTLLMAALVTPLGIIAAIYLHEYAKQGMMLQTIRICVNNLAGVPSIVFGVFGLGFFVYGVGGFIDRGPASPLPERWWFLVALLAILTLVGAILLAINTPPPASVRPRNKARTFIESTLWIAAILLTLLTFAKCPYFHGFFQEKLPSPTFGTGGILWASITLALMTLPVVIVATEEALSAVPRGVREAALACGASKWQMIQRIALPGALPGVMTGIILAMARGAGEVAPLMITGVVKLAPSLPIDGIAPFIHAERKFMHLGFHIFDLGFQSPDSEAAKPMVFATTLLLIFLVVVLNLAAIQIRSHLRRKYQASAF
jgi:ABC-type phosphate transport system permease subunit